MNPSLKTFLTLSVIVNLLLAGVIIGGIGRDFMGNPGHRMMPPPEMLKNWPADKREAFEHAVDQVNRDTEGLRSELHEAHRKLADIVRADRFDKSAYMQQMQRIHELHGKLSDHMAQAIADLAGQWDGKDRALLAEMVRGPMLPPPGEAPPHGHGMMPPPDEAPPASDSTPPPPPDDQAPTN